MSAGKAVVPELLLDLYHDDLRGGRADVLPDMGLTAIGDAENDLLRVLGPVEELTRIWRVLTTAELRRQARVASFFDYLVEQREALRPIITG